MNIIQKILAFFGREYVALQTHNGNTRVRHAYRLGVGGMWSHPYLPDTKCQLLPNGEIGVGPSYVKGWIPVTHKMQEFYSKGVEQ